jgi:nicotinamide riboside kinase
VFKIGIIGSHCVGKTTLAAKLTSGLLDEGAIVRLVPEVARTCPLGINDEATLETFFWIMARQIQVEIEESAHANILVCDRSIVDNFVYYARLFGTQGEQAKGLAAITGIWMKTYDLIVRLPITFSLTDDKYRSLDTGFQKQIDDLFDQIVESKYKTDIHPLYLRGPVSPEGLIDVLKQLPDFLTNKAS